MNVFGRSIPRLKKTWNLQAVYIIRRRWSIWTWRDLKKLGAEKENFEELLFLKKPFGQILHALEIDKEMSTVYKEETILAKTVETLSYKSLAEFLLNNR